MAAEDVKAARLKALCERKAELCVKYQEIVVEIAKVDLDIIRTGGVVATPIGGTIGGTIAGAIGGTIGGTIADNPGGAKGEAPTYRSCVSRLAGSDREMEVGMAERFRRSRFLQVVPREDGWAVFHSLFGNLALLDTGGKAFLDGFSDIASIEDAASQVADLPAAVLRSYANLLIARHFLIPDGLDDYALVEEDQQYRQANLRSGYLVRALQFVTCERLQLPVQVLLHGHAGRGAQYRARDRIGADDARTGGGVRAPVDGPAAPQRQRPPACRVLRRRAAPELAGDSPRADDVRQPARFGRRHRVQRHDQRRLDRPEIADTFKRYGVTVTISIDIPVKLAGLPIVMAKSGDRVRTSLAILRDTGNAVTFNSVISKETIASVDGRRLIDFAQTYHVGVVGLILDLDLAFYRCEDNRRRVQHILMDTYRYGRERGVRVMGYWHQIFSQIIGEQPINLRSGYKTCPATGVKLSVEPDGSVHACKCTSKQLGTITRLDEALASDTYAAYAMQAYRHAPDCAGCAIEGFCSGVCMGSFENEFDRRDMIETGACEIFRGITRELILDLPREQMPRLSLEGHA